MNNKNLLAYICSLMLLPFLAACSARQPAPTPIPPASPTPTSVPPAAAPPQGPATTSSAPDYWPTESWRTSTPEEQGMDSELLVKMFDFIREQQAGIHSVTIVRNGALVVDAAIYPYTPGSKHDIHSCTKSITSALIGIAIEQGYIESVTQPVLSFFPDRSAANLDAHKDAMTVEHLLMMASGLECRDSYLYGWRGIEQMQQTDDWVQFVLDLPMSEPPGTRFEYCNGASFLLSAIIQQTTGMSAAKFAEANLFQPLGISDVAWPSNPQGITVAWGGIRMYPQDMAKFGYLYLNEGRWDGEQIVPEEWVAVSTRKHIDATLQDGYGYQWWTAADGVYLALGYAGQFIFVVPEQELVVVFTSNLSDQDFRAPQNLLELFIIPAARSSTPLPANPDAAALLESKIRQAALTMDRRHPAGPPSKLAQRVNGQTYSLEPNPLGLQSVSLAFPQEEAHAFVNWTADPEQAQGYPIDPDYRQQGEWPIGLDNVFRFAPGLFEIPMGLKGRWESDETFAIECDYIGNSGQCQIQFTFAGDQLSLKVWEDGHALPTINGRLAQAPASHSQ